MERRSRPEDPETWPRAAICAAGRRLAARGLIAASEGNLSVRLSPATLLTTPTGRRKDELVPEDLVLVPLEPSSGPPPGGTAPSSDIAIHRAVYRARPDVLAVVHAHLPVSMALTLAGEVPDPAVLPETAHFLPVLPYVPFGAMGSPELATRIAAALSAADPTPGAALLERHGAVAVGTSTRRTGGPEGAAEASLEAALVQAVDRLELVDVLCRVWRDAILLRAARGLTGRPGPPGG